jgi:hypothetical protein
MWQEVGVAALVGLALSEAWLCLFMGASFAAADRKMAWGFLVGRTLGVTFLLVTLGLLGAGILGSKGWLVAFFAGSTICVAIVIAVSVFRPNLLGGCHHATEKGVSCDGGEPDGTGCSQGCDGCAAGGDDVGHGCSRMPRGLVRRLAGQNPWVTGMTLGGVRGAMPCLKVLIITPLLVVSPPTTVVMMAVAFALTSAIYPLIGMMSGKAVAAYTGHGRRLRLAGAIGVAAVGVYTLVKWYQATCELAAV